MDSLRMQPQVHTVGEVLLNLKAELGLFGKANDAAVEDPSRRMLNITHDTGEFLAMRMT